MNNFLKLFVAGTLALSFVGCASSDDASDSQSKSEEKTESKEEDKTYKLGETWEVPGQFKLTINSITPTEERNEYADEEDGAPNTVYVIDYTYENLGFDASDTSLNGLYFDLSLYPTVDAGGKMAHSYPIDVTYPQETPEGAVCDAQAAIAVENPGTITIHAYQYVGDKEEKATFEITPE